MLNTPWTSWVNYLHARLCYQLFITPIAFPMDKQYREFARHACAKMQKYRTENRKRDNSNVANQLSLFVRLASRDCKSACNTINDG